MRLYEGMFLIDNSEARKNYDAVSQNVTGIISKYGGDVKRSEKWAERKLAYRVKKRDRGTYILVYFEAPPESIPPIRRDCQLDEVILRAMIVRTDSIPEKKEEPPPASEQKPKLAEEPAQEQEPQVTQDQAKETDTEAAGAAEEAGLETDAEAGQKEEAGAVEEAGPEADAEAGQKEEAEDVKEEETQVTEAAQPSGEVEPTDETG